MNKYTCLSKAKKKKFEKRKMRRRIKFDLILSHIDKSLRKERMWTALLEQETKKKLGTEEQVAFLHEYMDLNR